MLSENANKILKDKEYYQLDEDGWEQLSCRVAVAIADAESTTVAKETVFKEIYDAMVNQEFIFSTPVLLNANVRNPGQLSSCFITAVEDNIESICNMDAEISKIFQRNGGAGSDLSVIRPAKSIVEESKGYAGGVISFMEKYDFTAFKMTEHNPARKGAIKINLQDWHPQFLDFIHAKDDTTLLHRMNISISLSDKFMEAVSNDADWNLEFPDYTFNKKLYNKHWRGDLNDWKSKGYPVVIHSTHKARYLLNELAKCAWKTGEPGVNFQDRMNEANMNKHLGTMIYTNPCLDKDTYMTTANGLEKINNITSKIWNGKCYSQTKTWMTGIKDTILITTNSGYEYITTPDHRFLLNDDTWCEAKDLMNKNIKFEICDKTWDGINLYPSINYEVLGFEFGDGTFHKASNRMKYIYANPVDDKEVIDLIENEFNAKFEPKDPNKVDTNHVIIIPNKTAYAEAFEDKILNRMIPDCIMQLPKKEMGLFLRGLFSANGSNILLHHKIQLVSINKPMLKQVQTMLSLFGIKAKLWVHNKSQDIAFSNGTYNCKESYHIVLSKDSYVKFLDKIGFIQSYKNSKSDYTMKLDVEEESVISIVPLGQKEVWDFTEPELHLGITNGAYVHNCSEFSNIPYSSCNLGSVNLLKFVKNGAVDYPGLRSFITKVIRWMDNMITVNKLPLSKIDKVTKAIRPIGMGVMGLADLLYILGIPYDSEEGIIFVEHLMAFVKDSAMKASMDLAIERGTYPAWKGSEFEKKGIAIRNSSLISIAPNGTIAIFAGVNGGIEPLFALSYYRTTNDGTVLRFDNEFFVETLKEKRLDVESIMNKVAKNHGSCQGIAEIPLGIRKVFVTAHDISMVDHVRIVSAVQKHTDLSVSKTINFGNEAVVEDLEEAIVLSHYLGLKGMTMYRDGARAGQTLSTLSTPVKETIIDPINPITLDSVDPISRTSFGDVSGTTYKRKTACGDLYITINKDEDGNLIEIFVPPAKRGTCKSNIEAEVRMASVALRGGIKVNKLYDQIKGIKCEACTNAKKCGEQVDGMSCPDIIADCIKKSYKGTLDEPSIVKKSKKKATTLPVPMDDSSNCTVCGEKLRHIGGCVECACGSKCG